MGMGPHAAYLSLTTSYFKATILLTFLFLFIFGDAEKQHLTLKLQYSSLFFSCLSLEMQRKKAKLKKKLVGQNKIFFFFIVVFSLYIFLFNLCDSRQFMILDPISG